MIPWTSLKKVLAVFWVALLLSPELRSQSGQGNLILAGRVRTQDGSPAAGIKVVAHLKEAKRGRTAAQRETMTDAKGHWAIPFIKQGTWVVGAFAAETMSELLDVPLNVSRTDIGLVLGQSTPGILVEAKNAVYGEDFPKAAEILEWFLQYFPRSRELGSALFWLAYVDNRLVPDDDRSGSSVYLLEKSVQSLDRLITEFPSSEWREDAEILRIDVALRLYQRGERRYADLIRKGVAAQGSSGTQVRLAALEGLLTIDGKKAVEELKAIVLHDPDSETRKKAVLILGQSGIKEARPLLEEVAAKDPDEAVKKAARLWIAR